MEEFKARLVRLSEDHRKSIMLIPMMNFTSNFEMAELNIIQSLGELNLRTQATKIDVKRLQEVVAVQQGQIATLTATVDRQQAQIAEQRAQIGALMGILGARLGQGPA